MSFSLTVAPECWEWFDELAPLIYHRRGDMWWVDTGYLIHIRSELFSVCRDLFEQSRQEQIESPERLFDAICENIKRRTGTDPRDAEVPERWRNGGKKHGD